MNAPSFTNRWLITGTLTTESELHIGDGFSAELTTRARKADKTKKEPEHDAQTVCVNSDGRAFIPGSSLKGPLRARVCSVWDKTWEDLLGSPDADKMGAVGGKLVFFDAPAIVPDEEQTFPGNDDPTRPWWNPNRRTAVAVSVSLDRRTRTAADKLLYHTEYVPAGQSFQVQIGGENLSEEEVARVLALLATFNDSTGNRTSLGAQGSSSWGHLRWAPAPVKCFDKSDLPAWLALDDPPTGFAACQRELPALQPGPAIGSTTSLLVFDLTLHFPGPLLVRDPRQAERRDSAKSRANNDTKKLPDAIPLLDENGRPCIPAKAIRGVLRSRAEMILRTLGVDVPAPQNESAVSSLSELPAASLAARLFGLPGWEAPLQCGRFTLADDCQPVHLHQEFVAIDRFTGGVAGSKKYDAQAIVGSAMTGRISLALDRLAESDRPLARRLLALLLRDLVEGDLCFGSGAAKGYGHCATATVTVLDAEPSQTWTEWLNEALKTT